MVDQPSEKPPSLGKVGWIWFAGFFILILAFLVLGLWDNSTELTPNEGAYLNGCFLISCVFALVSGGVGVWQTARLSVPRRVGLAIVFAFLGELSMFTVTSRAADIIQGAIDFPVSKTRSYQALLLISRAYQTHGKGRSWNIQTMPIWSNLDITEDDYNFMQAHRRPGDPGRDPDEISSQGYFCARVTLEQAGDAVRVMHAGAQKLPKGTVMICPTE